MLQDYTLLSDKPAQFELNLAGCSQNGQLAHEFERYLKEDKENIDPMVNKETHFVTTSQRNFKVSEQPAGIYEVKRTQKREPFVPLQVRLVR